MFKPQRKKVEIQEKLLIENTELTRFKKARYLGIIIDERLQFKDQHEKLVSKLTEAVNALICVRNTRVSVQGVKSLWGDCRFIPEDWGS